MIYIKDYGSLNDLVYNSNNSKNVIQLKFIPLIGRTITVFVDGGSISGCGFTGVLINVLSDSIKLVTKLPIPPNNPNISCNRNFQNDSFGTKTMIMLNHITALAYFESK